MAKESGLWAWLAKARRTLKHDLHMHRIENSVMAGMPDVEGYLKNGGQFWLELKAEERPVRPDTPVRFAMEKRLKQARWLQRRWALGAQAYLLVQVGRGSDRQIYLIPGCHAMAVRNGLTEAQLGAIASHKVGGYRVAPESTILAACNLMEKT